MLKLGTGLPTGRPLADEPPSTAAILAIAFAVNRMVRQIDTFPSACTHLYQVYQRAAPAALTHREVPRCSGHRLPSPPLLLIIGRDWSPPSFAGHVRRRRAPSYMYHADLTFEFRV